MAAISAETTWIQKGLRIRPEFNAFDNYDINHYDCLSKLASCMYKKFNKGDDREFIFQFAHMWDIRKDLTGELYYPVLIITIDKDAKWTQALNAMEKHYKCEVYKTQYYIYVTPWYHWELADFWLETDKKILIEGGLIDE